MNRVFLLDPGFESSSGHHASHDLRFVETFGRLEIFVPKALDPAIECPGATLTRSFTSSLYTFGTRVYSGRERLFKRVLRALKRKAPADVARLFERDLAGIFAARQISDRDTLIVHSEAPAFTLALARVLRAMPQERRPFLHIRFTNVDWVRQDLMGAYSALGEALGPEKLNLYVEYESLRGPVSRVFHGTPVALMRGPILPVADPPDRAGRYEARGRLKVLYFGALRRERGWYRLPSIAEKLRQRLDADITVHAGVPPEQQLGKLAKVIDEMRALEANVIVDRLPESGISDLLAAHDVVLLPYESEDYRLRGSSVALEAVLHACPMVVTRETIMEDLVRAGNGLAASTDDEFVNAIAEIGNSYTSFAKAAAIEARQARQWQDLEQLAAHIAEA